MYKKSQYNWVLVLFIFAGIVIGGLLGETLGGFSSLSWLRYGLDFGITNPFVLNLGIISLTFAFALKLNIAGILGIIISVLIYRFI